ncbi:hypothetical protein WN50_33975, partial [Limnoraphis robusta CS-951]
VEKGKLTTKKQRQEDSLFVSLYLCVFLQMTLLRKENSPQRNKDRKIRSLCLCTFVFFFR